MAKKDYWNDLGSQLWRTVINKGQIFYPKGLRGKVEYHIKKNGQVVLRKVKNAKKKKGK
jgi:hypothetical protein